MAISKNNRKKGQKRQAMHSKPASPATIRAEQLRKEEESKSERRSNLIHLLLTLGMLAGLIAAMCGAPRFGYPLTFVCSLGCLTTTSEETKHRKLVMACYLVYMLATAFMFYLTTAQQG